MPHESSRWAKDAVRRDGHQVTKSSSSSKTKVAIASGPLIALYIPEDKEFLSGVGKVALLHEQLNYILRMTIRTLSCLKVAEALDATASDTAARLRERIKKLARQRLGEGEPLLKLQALLERCKRATEKRNELIHSIAARTLDGAPILEGRGQLSRPLPKVAELSALAECLLNLIEELNRARFDGFLHAALDQ